MILAFPTAGRRDTLGRALRGFTRNALEHGHQPELLVAIDAPAHDPGDTGACARVEAVRRVVAAVGDELGVRRRVIDLAARRMLVAGRDDAAGRDGAAGRDRSAERHDPLIVDDPDVASALDFALVPGPHARELPGPGCNHNALLLATAGRLFVSTDDDVVADPALGPGAHRPVPGDDPAAHGAPAAAGPADGRPVEFTLNHLAHGLRFHADRQAAAADVVPVPRDIVGSHLALVGRTGVELPGAGIAAEPGRSPADASSVDGFSGRILVSTAGAYGDSGMGSPRAVLALTGADREHACATDENYRRLRLSRSLVRSSPVPRVGPSTHLMLMQAAMDNRVVLPPHFPIGRNSDGLFAVMVRVVHPGSLSAFQDFALRHDPPEERAFASDEIHRWRPNPADLVMHLVVGLAPSLPEADASDRLVTLGSALEEIARGPTSEFVSTVHQLWLHTATHHTELLEELVERHGGTPATWAADVGRFTERVYAMMQEPLSLFGKDGCGMSAEGMKRAVGAYGRVLAVWPRAWEAGRRAGSAQR